MSNRGQVERYGLIEACNEAAGCIHTDKDPVWTKWDQMIYRLHRPGQGNFGRRLQEEVGLA